MVMQGAEPRAASSAAGFRQHGPARRPPRGGRRSDLAGRVAGAAETALRERKYVTAVDVLVGLGWLLPRHLEAWRRGQEPDLERVTGANLHKISAAMRLLRAWATQRGLRPSETVYMSRTRRRHPLRFSRSGDESIERAYRTHWLSPALSAAKAERIAQRRTQAPDLVVVDALNAWECTACADSGRLLFMEGGGPLCLACADLDHLVFLASGDAALSRRAREASTLSAVVVRFSRSRKRYERQGLLVQETALAQAEAECLQDEDARERRRARAGERRAERDDRLATATAQEILARFPACPRIWRTPSLPTRRWAEAGAWVAARPAGRSTPWPCDWWSSPPCATASPPTTSS